jgi:hypothetical protein
MLETIRKHRPATPEEFNQVTPIEISLDGEMSIIKGGAKLAFNNL